MLSQASAISIRFLSSVSFFFSSSFLPASLRRIPMRCNRAGFHYAWALLFCLAYAISFFFYFFFRCLLGRIKQLDSLVSFPSPNIYNQTFKVCQNILLFFLLFFLDFFSPNRTFYLMSFFRRISFHFGCIFFRLS